MKPLTAPEIVRELDRSIVGQGPAKRALAIGIRNRWRSQQAPHCVAAPARRYLLSGSPGIGKSLLARQSARAIDAPFASVNALHLAGTGATAQHVVESMLESMVECAQSRSASVELAVHDVRSSSILLIEGLDRVFPAGPPDDSHEPHLEGLQQAFLRALDTGPLHTRYGDISTRDVLVIAESQARTPRLVDRWPDLQGVFPHRVELDGLTDDDLLHILRNTATSPIHYFVSLLASEGLAIEFAADGLDAIALEAGEQNRKAEDMGARRLAAVIETVLDDVLFDPQSAPSRQVTIDAGYVTSRITVDGDDDDLTDFIL